MLALLILLSLYDRDYRLGKAYCEAINAGDVERARALEREMIGES